MFSGRVYGVVADTYNTNTLRQRHEGLRSEIRLRWAKQTTEKLRILAIFLVGLGLTSSPTGTEGTVFCLLQVATCMWYTRTPIQIKGSKNSKNTMLERWLSG